MEQFVSFLRTPHQCRPRISPREVRGGRRWKWPKVPVLPLIGLSVMISLIGLTAGSNIPPAMAQTDDWQAYNPITVLQDERNFFLKIDLHDPRVRPTVLIPHENTGGLEPLSSMKDRLYPYQQWAVINADLFSHSCPHGVHCFQGLTYVAGEHKPIWSDYDRTYTIRGNIGFDANNDVEINVHEAQSKRYMTVGGGPRVLIQGVPTCAGELHGNKTFFPASGEWFDDDARWWCSDRRAISLVGYSVDKRFLYLGLSLGGQNVIQAAQWLRDQGAYEVLRLDSGGSSKMYFNGQYIGGRGSIPERPLANALAVLVDPSFAQTLPQPQPEAATWSPEAVPIPRYPKNGVILTSRLVTFRWDGRPTHQDRFVLRIEDASPNAKENHALILQQQVQGEQYTVTLHRRFENRDLAWRVRADHPDSIWSVPQLFRIDSSALPLIEQ